MEETGGSGMTSDPKIIALDDRRPVADLYARWSGADEEARQTDLLPGAEPIWIEAGEWSEKDIPVRPWIARGYLMRGAVTVVSGPGSAGKSSLMIGWCVALALGLDWHGFRPGKPHTVLTYNVEDDAHEQRRRLSATLRQFDRQPRDLGTRVVRIGPSATGTLLRRDPITGRLTFTKAMTALEEQIEQRKPDVVILDPMVELHDAEENDNMALRAVMAKFRAIAAQHNIAVVILHHSRKGASASPGDPDTLRGASSIVGAARIVLTVMVMQEADAKALGVTETRRSSYFRVDGAKSNYAPLHEAEWFERIAYELDNGEETAAAVPWRPVNPLSGISIPDINVALDRIAAGPRAGTLFAASRRGRSSERWSGNVLVDAFGLDDAQAGAMLSAWFKSGLLSETTYRDKTEGKDRLGVVVNDLKRPT